MRKEGSKSINTHKPERLLFDEEGKGQYVWGDFSLFCHWLLINSLKLLDHYVMEEPNHGIAPLSTSPL